MQKSMSSTFLPDPDVAALRGEPGESDGPLPFNTFTYPAPSSCQHCYLAASP
ncbi:hypothetical protein BDW68DRAFT_162965 [Aspergillus falconensis]